jgi:beta-galactosidase
LASLQDGRTLVALNQRACYVAGGLDDASWVRLLEHRAQAAGLSPERLPPDLRVSRIGPFCMTQNFSTKAIDWSPTSAALRPLLGESRVEARGLTIWRLE